MANSSDFISKMTVIFSKFLPKNTKIGPKYQVFLGLHETLHFGKYERVNQFRIWQHSFKIAAQNTQKKQFWSQNLNILVIHKKWKIIGCFKYGNRFFLKCPPKNNQIRKIWSYIERFLFHFLRVHELLSIFTK